MASTLQEYKIGKPLYFPLRLLVNTWMFLEVLSQFWKCSLISGSALSIFGSALSFLEVLSHFWKCSLISGSALSFLHYSFNGVDVARKTEDIAKRICLLSVFYWFSLAWLEPPIKDTIILVAVGFNFIFCLLPIY